MPQKAKVFTNGRSQAVRLPKEFRFAVSEVFIRRDPSTGDVILSSRHPEPSWEEFFQAVHEVPAEERNDFLLDRNLIEAQRGDLL
jgi:antitoxin VapB